MKKIILFTNILLLSTGFGNKLLAAYGGGSGTEAEPYLISSKTNMEELATAVNNEGKNYSGVYFRLTCDLTGTNDTLTTLVGNSETTYFSGIFDGDGHKIAVKTTGIFGRIQGATIKNLGVTGRINTPSYSDFFHTDDYSYAGGICALAENSEISHCYNNAEIAVSVSSSELVSGGICGRNINSNINKCHNTGNISSSISYSYSYSGGISGYEGTITNCYNTGSVSSSSSSASFPYPHSGGICGAYGTVSNCYNTGNISSSFSSSSFRPSSFSGGICAFRGTVSNCFVSDMQITTSDNSQTYTNTGRIDGGDGNYVDCYAYGVSVNGNSINGTDKNGKNGQDAARVDLQSQSWLTDTLGWDFNDIWCEMGDGKLPELQMQYPGYQQRILALEPIPDIVYGDQATLNVTRNDATTPIVYTFSDTEIVELSGNQLTAKKIGTVTITASQPLGNGFFFGKYVFELTVVKKELTVTPNPENIVYGDALPSAYTFRYEGFIEGDTETALTLPPTATTEATITSNAGEYPITASGGNDANYEFTYQPGTLTIAKRDLTAIPNDVSRVYGDENPAFTLSYTGFVNGDTESVIATPPTATTPADITGNAGEYPITASGGNDANYNFVYETGTLTITKAPLTATVNSANRNYGAPNPAFTVNYSGFRNAETSASLTVQPQAECAALPTSGIGDYPVTLSGGESTNYEFVYETGTLTITKAPLTVAVNSANRNYGAPNPAFTVNYSGFRNADTTASLTVQPQAVCAATPTSGVGNYPVTLSGGESTNYEFYYAPGTLTVQRAQVTITADAQSSLYGEPLPLYTAQYSGFANNESTKVLTQWLTFTCNATTQSNAGQYPITPSGAAARNYTFNYQSGTLTIEKRPLTVTPDSATRMYGDANPAFVLSYTGFINGETETVLTLQPTASTTAGVTANVGEYPITLSDGDAVNYDLACQPGTLTVTKAPLTITADSLTYQPGGPDPVYTLTYSGFRNGDNESVLDELPQITCNADKDSPAGFYDIILSDNGHDNNYSYTLVNGHLEVLPETKEVLPGTVHAETATDVPVVYPNPVRSVLYIRSAVTVEQVIIHDLSGKMLKQVAAPNGEVNVSDLTKGVYLVRIKTSAGETVRKMVKE